MKKTLYIITLILFAACSSKLYTPTQADVVNVSSKFPNITLVQLQEGKANYEKYCGSCHSLYKPTDFDEPKWRHEVPDMARKMKRKQNIDLDAATQDNILKYLITMRLSKK
jgi:cytochrome c5